MNNVNDEQPNINMNLTVEELERWQESWLQPSLLTIALQKQLLINRILAVVLAIATIALFVVTWFKIRSC